MFHVFIIYQDWVIGKRTGCRPLPQMYPLKYTSSIMHNSYNSSRALYSLVAEWHCNPRRRCSRTRIRSRLEPDLQVSKSSEMEIQRGIRDEDLRLANLECASFPHTI